MKHVFSIAACIALAQASPLRTPLTKRFPSASVTFNGAAGASYDLTVPLDGVYTPTNNALSISSITSDIDIGTQCVLSTVDSPPPVLVEGPPGTWVVGPPQTVNGISCNLPESRRAPTTVEIEFDGAADAKYFLTVALGGGFTPTNNVLSISNLVSNYDVTKCTFSYIDGSAVLVNTGPNTWAVGPPQTIIGVSC